MECKRVPWGISAGRLKQQPNGHGHGTADEERASGEGRSELWGDSLIVLWVMTEGDSVAAERPISSCTSQSKT